MRHRFLFTIAAITALCGTGCSSSQSAHTAESPAPAATSVLFGAPPEQMVTSKHAQTLEPRSPSPRPEPTTPPTTDPNADNADTPDWYRGAAGHRQRRLDQVCMKLQASFRAKYNLDAGCQWWYPDGMNDEGTTRAVLVLHIPKEEYQGSPSSDEMISAATAMLETDYRGDREPFTGAVNHVEFDE